MTLLHLPGRPVAILDQDIPKLLGVEESVLVEVASQHKQHLKGKFFKLTDEEWESSAPHRRFRPRAFTLNGIITLRLRLGDVVASERMVSVLSLFTRHFGSSGLMEEVCNMVTDLKKDVVSVQDKLEKIWRYGRKTRQFVEDIEDFGCDVDGLEVPLSQQAQDRVRLGIERLVTKIIEHYRVLGPGNLLETREVIWQRFNRMNGVSCFSHLSDDKELDVFIQLKRLKTLVREKPDEILGSCRWWGSKKSAVSMGTVVSLDSHRKIKRADHGV